jgi:hypothetical protein
MINIGHPLNIRVKLKKTVAMKNKSKLVAEGIKSFTAYEVVHFFVDIEKSKNLIPGLFNELELNFKNLGILNLINQIKKVRLKRDESYKRNQLKKIIFLNGKETILLEKLKKILDKK